MVDPIPLSGLAEALGLGAREHVAIVGGGGKTTLLHALGRQLPGATVLTCTTKMGSAEHRGLPVLLSPTTAEVAAAARSGAGGDSASEATGGPGAPPVPGVIVWRAVEGAKAVGVTPEACDEWFQAVDQVVVEADGSKQRPFKAPANYEPVVPRSVTAMVSVIGADALGRVIADQCHRPLRVAALAGCQPYRRLSPGAAATVLLHPRGARKELPPSARFAVVVTKTDASSAPLVAELMDRLDEQEPGVTVIVVGRDLTPPPGDP